MKKILYWVRKDLRAHDNLCLQWASRQPCEILIIYPYPKELLRSENFRQQFQAESLIDFSGQLSKLDLQFYAIKQPAEMLIPDLVKRFEIDELVYQSEISPEEIDTQNTVLKKLSSTQCQAKSFWQSSLILKKDLPFPFEQFPNGFSDFRKKVEYQLVIQPPVQTKWENLKQLDAQKLEKPKNENSNLKSLFKGGESEALKRLDHYLWKTDAIASYKETRNGMILLDDSSKFSPWLANGCLSPRMIYQELTKYEQQRTQNESTYWMFFELLWRDYFKFYVNKYGASVFKLSGIGKKKSRKLLEAEEHRRFAIWTEGMTGYPLVDACMRELKQTGWMSNRGRQNAASFLAKTLEVDWRWGAQYFEKYLLDYDLESNWGNWNYVAGVGTDPRDRCFNVIKQSYDYDPSGDYIRMWIPELSGFQGSEILEPWAHNSKFLKSGYPERMV